MIPHVHRRQVSQDEDPVPVEVRAAVEPLSVGLLLGRDVGEAVPDPRHWAADRGHRPRQFSDCGGSGSTYSALPPVSL